MGAKPKVVSIKSARAKPGPKSGPKPGPGTTPPPTVTKRLWTSNELQSQIGSKNKDKKKLVMEIYCEHSENSLVIPVVNEWAVKYRLKAEDKDLTGSGWHTVNKLVSLSYNFKYKIGNAAPVTSSGSVAVSGLGNASGVLIGSSMWSTAQLPTFLVKQATGVRSGGPSGIQIIW